MKLLKIINILLTVSVLSNGFANPPIDTPGTLALWHMDEINPPPIITWFVQDDDSVNLGRYNDLLISASADIVPGGVYGNALYFDGSNSFSSTNNWVNEDTIKIEFDFKPVNVKDLQKLFEITSAISLRFQLNSGLEFGRILFYVYNSGTPILVNSGWKPLSDMTNNWNHVVAMVESNGNFSVSLDGTTDGTGTGLSGIDNAYINDARCFVGGDRLNGYLYNGYIDEVKISHDVPEYPRLLFSPGDIARLRNKAQSGTAKEIYTLMKSKADSYLSISTNPYYFADATAGRLLSRQLLTLGMTGYVSDDTKYINKAIDILCAAINQSDVNTFVGFNGHLAVADAARGYAIAYDWLRSYMTAGQINTVEAEIYQFGEWLYNEINTTYVGENIPRRYASNHNSGTAGALGLCGLTLGYKAPTVWISRATHQMTNYFTYSTDSTGCAYEGMGYQLYGFQGAIPFSVAYEREKGIDIFEEKMNQISQYFMWQLLPTGYEGISINQSSRTLVPAGGLTYLISKYQDNIGLWGWKRFTGDTYGYTSWAGTGPSLPYSFLWYDNNMLTIAPNTNNVGQSKLFTRGQISARDGWTNNDSLVTFTSGTGWAGCWNHSDENSFTFDAKSDRFVIDAASGYTASTNHNTIVVDNIGQNNDGHAGLVIGEIVSYYDSNDYVYIYGDATAAYNVKADAIRAKRQLLYVRAPQPYVVVADDFAVDDYSSHNYTFLLHTAPQNSIIISNNTTTITGGNAGSQCYIESIWPTGVSITETPLSGTVTSIYKELKINTYARTPDFINLLVAAGNSESMPVITKTGNWSEMIINILFSSGREDKITVTPTNIKFEKINE